MTRTGAHRFSAARWSVIPKTPAPDLVRGGYRFSENIISALLAPVHLVGCIGCRPIRNFPSAHLQGKKGTTTEGHHEAKTPFRNDPVPLGAGRYRRLARLRPNGPRPRLPDHRRQAIRRSDAQLR